MSAEKPRRRNIFEAMAAANQRIEAIANNERHQKGFMFRGANQIFNHVHPIFKSLGIIVTSKILDKERINGKTKNGGDSFTVLLTVEYIFHAPDGSNISTQVATEAIDYADKATAQAMTIALKTALTQTFLIPTQDISEQEQNALNAVGEGSTTISTEQEKEIEDLILTKDFQRSKLMLYMKANYKINVMRDVPTTHFDEILSLVASKKDKEKS